MEGSIPPRDAREAAHRTSVERPVEKRAYTRQSRETAEATLAATFDTARNAPCTLPAALLLLERPLAFLRRPALRRTNPARHFPSTTQNPELAEALPKAAEHSTS